MSRSRNPLESPRAPLSAEQIERNRLEGYGPKMPEDDPNNPLYEPDHKTVTAHRVYGNPGGGDGGEYKETTIKLTAAGERRKRDSENLRRIRAEENEIQEELDTRTALNRVSDELKTVNERVAQRKADPEPATKFAHLSKYQLEQEECSRVEQIKAEEEHPTGGFFDRMRAAWYGGGTRKYAELVKERDELRARLQFLQDQANDQATASQLTYKHQQASTDHTIAHARRIKGFSRR